ncbi:MAG: hypothetical protein IIC51_08035 [Planctomycetes bacterium]|nr:hypothetical protein [Planctomycetota bacterium]
MAAKAGHRHRLTRVAFERFRHLDRRNRWNIRGTVRPVIVNDFIADDGAVHNKFRH